MSRRSPRLPVKEAAGYLGVSTKTVHRLINRWKAGDPAGRARPATGGAGWGGGRGHGGPGRGSPGP